MLDIVRLNIQLTRKCNQRCISCNSCQNVKADLQKETVKDVIEQVTKLFDIKNIAFTGGEPTLYSDFLELASFARAKSDKVSITTNGYYCTTKEKVIELIKAGVNRFSFSYHGIGTHDYFTRIKGSEQNIRNAIDYVVELKGNNDIYCKIGTLYTGDNIDSVERVLEYAEMKGLQLYIELLDDRIPIFANNLLAHESSKKNVEKDILRISKWKKENRPVLIDEEGICFIEKWFGYENIIGECPLWKTDIYIESNGNFRTGCWSLDPAGNVYKESVENIVYGERFQRNIDYMKRRQCSGCTCGYLMQAKYLK